MFTYLRTCRTFAAERMRRVIGALMSLNDPQWGRRGGTQGPPDLDELMRNFNQKLGALFGRKGGGNGGGATPAGRALRISAAVPACWSG